MKKEKPLYQTKDFTVRRSQVPNAGYGLYVNRPFQKGESLGPYKGKLLTMEECNQDKYLPLWGHMLDMTGIEGIEPYVALHPSISMVLRYINHAPTSLNGKKISGKKSINVEFNQIDRHPYIEIRAIRDIESGDEVFLNYGKGFTNMFMRMNKDLKNFYK